MGLSPCRLQVFASADKFDEWFSMNDGKDKEAEAEVVQQLHKVCVCQLSVFNTQVQDSRPPPLLQRLTAARGQSHADTRLLCVALTSSWLPGSERVSSWVGAWQAGCRRGSRL